MPNVEYVDDRRCPDRFITEQTRYFKRVVDLGSGKSGKRQFIPPQAEYVAVEVFERLATDYGAVCMDMRQVPGKGIVTPETCVMLIDALEHISHKDGEKMLKALQKEARKIIVFTPEGMLKQDDDAWGMDNKHQVHVSGWLPDELHDLGFDVVVDRNQRGLGEGALFAVWNKH